MQIEFSFIIAVYNCKKYIRRCIDSVIEQQSSSYELIIVDDGSTDGTEKICDEYCAHKNVKVIHQSNLGHTAARKRGISEAQGKYVCIIDADDWIDENYIVTLEKKIEALEYSPDIIAFNFNRVTQDKNRQPVCTSIKAGEYDKEQLISNIYPIMLSDPKSQFFSFGLFPTLWSKVFKKNIILQVINMLDTDIVLGEDAFCVYLSVFQADSLLVLEDCLYNYLINDDSISHRYAKNNFEKLTKLCELMDTKYPAELLDQVRKYKLLMLMGAITNETRGPLPTNNIVRELKRRCELNTFVDCIENAAIQNIPLYRRIMWKMLKLKMYSPLVYLLRLFKA